jgi:dTDP-glucose 4,6-dehydratase
MKVLVTGGAGFIGSALIRKLLGECSHEVINIDKITYASNPEALAEISGNADYHFYKEDICNQRKMTKLVSEIKPNVIMHLAAESHVDNSIDDPKIFLETNILGTFSMLQAALHYYKELDYDAQQQFRFHHISTDEVYGDLEFESNELFHERTPYNPSSPYSASKAASDHLVRSWKRTFNLPTIITNCSNNYGPFQNKEKFIPTIVNNALAGKKIPVYGNGKQIRDWLHVDDHVQALWEVVSNGKIGETYNIGGNSEIQNIELVKLICRCLDQHASQYKHGSSSFEELIYYVTDRPGHDKRYAIDNSKIKSELGWSPKYNLKQGIENTVLWYLNNKLKG